MAFADVLAENEALLTVGANLVVTVEAEAGAESGRLMLRAVQTVEEVTADAAASGLRVFVTGPEALPSIRSRLEAGAGQKRLRGEGPVHLVMSLAERGEEVEMALPGAWRIGPEIRGALKAAPGVAHVEEF
jgi:DNA polymerase-3 subunit alpha